MTQPNDVPKPAAVRKPGRLIPLLAVILALAVVAFIFAGLHQNARTPDPQQTAPGVAPLEKAMDE